MKHLLRKILCLLGIHKFYGIYVSDSNVWIWRKCKHCGKLQQLRVDGEQ